VGKRGGGGRNGGGAFGYLVGRGAAEDECNVCDAWSPEEWESDVCSEKSRTSSLVSIYTFVPVSKYFCTSKASEHLMRGRCGVGVRGVLRLLHLLRCRNLYFCTSKASKLSSKLSKTSCPPVAASLVAAGALVAPQSGGSQLQGAAA
jgi:hypothetical protein